MNQPSLLIRALLLFGATLVFFSITPTECAAQAAANITGLSAKLQDAEQALTLNPNDAVAQATETSIAIRLALYARSQGRLNDALAYLLRAGKWDARNPELLLDTGVLEEQMHLYVDADRALAKAEALAPSNPKILYAVARVKMDLGQMQASEDAWKRYLQMQPDDASAHYGYGLLLLFANRPAEARTQFRTSLRLDSHSAEARYRLGEIARNAGDTATAKRRYREALAIDPRHPGALTGIGILEFQEKHYRDAADDLKRATAIAPSFQTAHYYYGLTLRHLGQNAESAREMAIAVKLANELNAHHADEKQLASQASSSIHGNAP